MKEEQLSRDDIELILESLEYTKMNFTHGQDAPYELRRINIEKTQAVMDKLRVQRDKLPKR